MKRWQQKALVQKTVSFLPYPHQINFLFQRFITKGVNLTDQYLTDRLTHASRHIGVFERHAPGRAIDASLELGTGWYPIIPVCLFLHGAKEVHTVDIAEHCSRARILATLKIVHGYHTSGRLESFVNVRADRWEALRHVLHHAGQLSKDELLDNLHIKYTVGDARRLSLADGSISLITSNNTLEHVPADILRGLLVEFRRLAATGGVMSHFIDMSDHFARLDPSITIYNYLRYSKRQWKWIDNTIQPQNRLRISHYRALYAELGIPITEERRWEGSVEALSKVDVHPDFAGIPLPELAIRYCLLVSRM
jgi:hypothetical protein